MGKKLIIQCVVSLLILLPCSNQAQDVNLLLKEAQQFESSFKDGEALQKYVEVIRLQPQHIMALSKASELNCIIGKRQATKEKQKAFYRMAQNYAQRALQAGPNNSAANCAMAVATGRLAMMASGDEKIKGIKEVKIYAEKSIKADATNFKAWHILAKWHYEVSDLNGVERWLVKVAYESLPKASLDEAIKDYEKSRQLNPGFILNYLELAKAYHRKDNDKKAVELLEAMMKLPNTFTDDASIKVKGKKLLEEYK
jgi:tetratricopeptide (TPR) repeat protein